MSLSDFRGRGRGGFRGRGRGGPPRGGGFRGGYSDRGDRGGFRGRGRGDGYSRGGPHRRMSRDDMSPPRKAPLLSKSYDSRRSDYYEDGYGDRGPPPRSRDSFSSPMPRESSRLSPPRVSSRDRSYMPRGGSGRYPSARGDYVSPRSHSPLRESGSYRDSFSERKETFRSTSSRDYLSPRSTSDYRGERPPRETRDAPRDYGSSRDYPPRDLGPRDDFRDRREYSSRSFSSRMSGERPARDYPPPREYRGRGGPRGGRDFYSNGRGRGGPMRGRGGPPRGRGGPPRGRGRPDMRHSSRSPPPSSRESGMKRPRMSPDDGYSRR